MSVFTDDRLARSRRAAIPGRYRLLRRVLLRRLAELRHGSLEIVDADGSWRFGELTPQVPRQVRVEIQDPRAYAALALKGTIGAGEAYFKGYWTCDRLVSLIRILVANRSLMDGLEGGLARVRAPLERLAHRRRRNTPRRSRGNISAHYDLGNDFFSCILDETMTYSCAVFPDAGSSLAQASRHKLELICRKLSLKPTDHVLEIGTGWGGFAMHAARRYGCRVTTTTISRQQHEYVAERVRQAGLQAQVELLQLDYRQLPALRRRFDKLVSVEMIEAVGHEYLDSYFRVCSDMLEPHGAMLLQAIVIADRLYERYRRGTDFIQRYVFPGGALPSSAAIAGSLERVSDLQVAEVQDITEHYAKTLRIWRSNLHRNRGRIRQAGYSNELLRLWDFYFAYCEGGFRERSIGTVQMLLHRPPGPRRPGNVKRAGP